MFPSLQRIKDHIQEIVSLVGIMTGYLMAVTGRSPTPWPQTTAVLLMIVSALFLWRQWWPRISRQSSLLLPASIAIQISPLESFLDPLRSSSRRSYALPLARRRTEGTILFALSAAAIALSLFRLPAVGVETFQPASSISMDCVGDGSADSLQILIAEFNKATSSPFLEDRLFDLLTNHSKWMGKVRTCRTDIVIRNQTEAIEMGEQTLSAIVVWGRSDATLYEVNFEVAEWALPNMKFRAFPTPEAMTPEFQLREPFEPVS